MSSEIFEVVASCSNTAEEFFASMYGTVCAPQLSPISSESQLVKLRAPVALAVRRDQAAIGVVGVAGGDALGDDAARGVLAEVDHLGAGIDLLVAVRDRDRVELAARVVAAQDAARVFPGDGRAGLDLGPGNLRVACRGSRRAWSRSCRCRPCPARRRDTSSGRSST